MPVTKLELGALKHERTEILNAWNIYSLILEIQIFVRKPDCELLSVTHLGTRNVLSSSVVSGSGLRTRLDLHNMRD